MQHVKTETNFRPNSMDVHSKVNASIIRKRVKPSHPLSGQMKQQRPPVCGMAKVALDVDVLKGTGQIMWLAC